MTYYKIILEYMSRLLCTRACFTNAPQIKQSAHRKEQNIKSLLFVSKLQTKTCREQKLKHWDISNFQKEKTVNICPICFMYEKKTTKGICNYIHCLLTTPTCFDRLLQPSSRCTVLKSTIKSCVCVANSSKL